MVLAVNAWDEPREQLAEFAKEKKLKHRILLNGGDVFSEKYNLSGIPILFWIDAQGVIIATDAGFDDPKSLERQTAHLVDRRD